MEMTKKQEKLQARIINTIYDKGPISRIDISKDTGITPATVSLLTNNLITQGLLYELGEVELNTAGRKKILLDFVSDFLFYAGVEINETFISFVIIDNTGNIKIKNKITINEGDRLSESDFIYFLTSFLEKNNYIIQSIGIAIPGHYGGDNSPYIITNNIYWKKFNLVNIKKAFNIPVYFANNVNCMLLAETLFNRENKRSDNFAFIHFGRGIYMSYLYEGYLFSRDNFLIGEIGHSIVALNGELCECGKRGCLQTYAGEAWLIKKAKILFEHSSNSLLNKLVSNPNDITLGIILAAYMLGDDGIVSIINTAISYISMTLINLNMMIDTKKIIIHGKLFNNSELYQLLIQHINNEPALMSLSMQNIDLKVYTRYNGAIGACALAIKNDLLDK